MKLYVWYLGKCFCYEIIYLYCLLLLVFVVCLNGIFGVECEFICGYCYGNSVCDYVNGSCVSGCLLGWVGIVCNESERIWF